MTNRIAQFSVLTEEPSIIVRSTVDMVRVLTSIPPQWRAADFAQDAQERAEEEGDDDGALFWSEVLTLLEACEEAGIVVPDGDVPASTAVTTKTAPAPRPAHPAKPAPARGVWRWMHPA